MADGSPTIYSMPQRIIHTIAVRICGEPVISNMLVGGKVRDIVIPDILVTIDSKLSFDDREDWIEVDVKDEQGEMWKHIVIDGGLVIERHRGTMRRLADTLVERVSEFDDEEILDFEWGDEEDDPIGSLRTEDLLLPHFSVGEDAGEDVVGKNPIERVLSSRIDAMGHIVETEKHPNSLHVKAMLGDLDIPLDELFFQYHEFEDGKGCPVYKTIEGSPVLVDDDISKIKGKVISSTPTESGMLVEFFVDSESFPDLAYGIKEGHISDVGVNFTVGYSECSICGNIATKETEWCHHVAALKGTILGGKPVVEIMHDVKFMSLSIASPNIAPWWSKG